MMITECRIKLVNGSQFTAGDRLLAFATITLDGVFVVRDLKVVDGRAGMFVAMPSRKIAVRCQSCNGKNALHSRFCNSCGCQLSTAFGQHVDSDRPAKLFVDVAHPITKGCRASINQTVVDTYREELERSKQPGYVCAFEDWH